MILPLLLAASALFTSSSLEAALAPWHPVEIGRSVDGHPLLAVRIGQATRGARPAALAIFGEHPDEHDTVLVAVELIRRLAAHPPANADLWVVPMLNPDGADRDLASTGHPFTLRVNDHGVNLNRNWGRRWEAAAAAGPGPFSEPETSAVRRFILTHPEIKALVDFHSGQATFWQGQVLLPYAADDHNTLPPAELSRYQTMGDRLAHALTNAHDPRPGVVAMQSWQVRGHVAGYLKQHVPPAHLAEALASLPSSTAVSGSSIDWAYGERRMLAMGVELSNPSTAHTPQSYAAAYARREPALSDGIESFFRTLLDAYVAPETRYKSNDTTRGAGDLHE